MKSEEVKALLKGLDDLIEIKTLIRKVVPNYELEGDLNKNFISLLQSLQNGLQPIFASYLKNDGPLITLENVKESILELLGARDFVLISSNSSKKKLKNIGIDTRNLFVSGGPLVYEDYIQINPNLPEKTIPGIKKKCETLLNEIKKEDWTEKDLIFICETTNSTDQLILERLDEISKIIGKTVKVLKVKSWKELDS